MATVKNGLRTEFFYDGYNNGGSIFDSSAIKPNRTTDPRGVVTTVVYDSLYRPISSTVTDPGLHGRQPFTAVTFTEYDLNGKPTKVTDPLNRVTLNKYDDFGNLTKVTEPDLTTDTSDNPTVQSYYTHHGKPWKVIDQMGNETTTRYDALGRPVEVKGPPLTLSSSPSLQVSAITTTEYDAAGNVIAVTDPLGRVVETEYDERNRPTHVYAPTMWDAVIGQFVRPYAVTTYDALGQPLSVTDHTGATTTSHYDRAGRKWKVEAPAVAVSSSIRPTTLTYFDPGGLPVTVTNPLGQTITNTYNIHGQLVQTDDAEGIINSFDYDAVGNRTLVSDGLGQITEFYYDGLNRLIRQ
jgi:YD repeat-containing protein